MLVDSHCHLDFEELSSRMDEVLANAKENKIEYMQTICTRISKVKTIIDIASKHENIFASVGVHPNNVAEEMPFTKEQLSEYTSHPKVIGIGETGLDYYYENSDRKQQQDSFRMHIEVARESGLPIIVHTRSADDDTLQIVADEMKKGEFKGLIHCFTASKDFAYKVMDLGFYISISGIVTFKNAKDLADIAKDLPVDRLLVETDAPYLAPQPFRGKVNEPAYTKHTAAYLADLKQLEYDDLCKITTNNFFQLFSKANDYIMN